MKKTMSEFFDVNNIFNENDNYVITASAGTGKTYQIVEIVKKLVNDYNIPIEEILLVTYTEKAAGELKNRIRKAIGDKKNIDKATIGTIHSFCQGVIEEFFISAGKPAKQVLISEDNVELFLKKYIRMGEISGRITTLKRSILNVFSMSNLFTDNNQDNKELFNSIREKIKKELKTNVENEVIDYLKEIILKYYLNDKDNEEPGIISLAKEYKNIELYKIYNREGENLLVNYIDRCINNQNDPQDIVKDYFGKKGIVKQIVKCLAFDYADKAYIQWQIEKRKHHEQTYNDMLRNVREEVVNERPLLKKLRGKYKYAIIDEFQDTNQIQWDIFRKVFVEDQEHRIVVVGDPKQSIYSFQGADLSVFYKARNEITNNQIVKGHDCYININYRSTQEMIKCTTEFFNIEYEYHDKKNKKKQLVFKGKLVKIAKKSTFM